MRNLILYILLLAIASACGNGSETEQAVTDSLMTEIFVDLHLLQARNSLELPLSGLTRDSVITYYGMTPAEFETQMHYYANHPAAYSALQNKITDRLGAEVHSVRGY